MVDSNPLSYDSTIGNRIITQAPIFRNIISYGIVLYCRQSCSVVVVQRRYTPEFIILVRGSYRPVLIRHLYSRITTHEYQLLISAGHESNSHESNNGTSSVLPVSSPNVAPNLFLSLYSKLYPLDKDISYAEKRLRHSCRVALQLGIRPQGSLSWMFPRGRMLSYEYPINTNVENVKESPFTCARRELLEETGINLLQQEDNIHYISDSYYTDITITYNGRNVESRYWLCIVNNHIPLPTTFDDNEIADRQWIRVQDLDTIMDTNSFLKNIVRDIELITGQHYD